MSAHVVNVPCAWFVGCTRDAVGVVAHPVLGWVPCCQRCADRLGLDLRPAQFVSES